VKPGGTSTCARPGTAAKECGAGIIKGAALNFTLQYYSGIASLQTLMDDEAASWDTVGIKVLLEPGAGNTVFAAATPCPKGCSWEMGNSGGEWEFTPDTYPTGDELFLTGAGANYGEYNNATNNANITATYVQSGTKAIYTYQAYLAEQLPDVWQPLPLTAAEVRSNLDIGAFNPLLNITPETWHFTRAKS
jgi:peptide/nickel transport system substrate-binding protein